MLYTFVQIVAFQAIFLLVYDLFLRRETFFNYNRVYLIITSVTALILPFIKLPELQQITPKDVVIQLPEVFIGDLSSTPFETAIAEETNRIAEQSHFPIWKTVLYIGIAITALIFLLKLIRLFLLKQRNPKHRKGNILIVELLKSTAAFSFFNTIFLGDKISENEKVTIYKHELVHVKQWHTLDLLLFEVLRIFFWFNPLIYIYQSRVKELHEFIADESAVKQSGKTEYYQSLLSQIFDVHNISFTNTFYKKSLIKKRITMLEKSKSKQVSLTKYALLIPLIFAMLFYTSIEVSAQENGNKDVKSELNQSEEKEVETYYNEIIASDISPFDAKVREGYNYKEKKYIPTKEEYLKYVAYMRYTGEVFKSYTEETKKTTKEQKKRYEEMISLNKSYESHLEYLKTEESKQQSYNANYNRTLRVISNDIDKLTEEEHNDAFEKTKDVLKGNLYKKLIISDDNESEEITKSNYDALVRFFSVDEIKTLLTNQKTKDKIVLNDPSEVPFSEVEEVPTLSECADLKTNEERKRCFNDFIHKHVSKNFNTKLGDSLSSGRKRIFVQFKIDTEGQVLAIKARGPSEELEDEAKRVIKLLPKFIPGRQNDEPVIVPYALPIVFEIVNSDTTDSPSTPNYKRFIEKIKKKDALSPEKKSFSVIEKSPVHPDCKTLETNEERKKCTTSAVNTFIGQNFNTKMAEALDLPKGKQRIFVNFTIDKQGIIKDVKARAPHEKLEEEAIRVINLLPQFIPGENEGEKVDVPFSLPIVFMVAKDKKTKN